MARHARGSGKGAAGRLVAPQLAVTVDSPPPGEGWLHEIEFDGYRVRAILEGGRARLLARPARDWTSRFPEVATALEALPLEGGILDGEVALVEASGRTNLEALRQAMRRKDTSAVVYFVFDVLELGGEDLTDRPLVERRRRLAEALAAAPPGGPVRVSLAMACDGPAFLAQARAYGVPGVVSKRADEPYRPGRSRAWLKTPCAAPEIVPPPRVATRSVPPIRLTNPERVLYEQVGITKYDLARYYTDIADWILPHLAGRPLSIVRCPDGLSGPHFFQKHAGAAVAPSLIKRVPTPEGALAVLAVTDLDDLLALVQIAALEIHAWGCRLESIETPDRLVIDLDPDPTLSWSALAEAAREVRARLAGHGLESYLKTTGGKGLHVVAPLAPAHGWPVVKEFTHQIALAMAADSPARYTVAVPFAHRRGRILIDYLRNARGSTAVAAYSTRAREDAAVSVPLAWDEISSTIPPVRWTAANLVDRLAALAADPWEGISRLAQTLPRRAVETQRLTPRASGPSRNWRKKGRWT